MENGVVSMGSRKARTAKNWLMQNALLGTLQWKKKWLKQSEASTQVVLMMTLLKMKKKTFYFCYSSAYGQELLCLACSLAC